MSEADRNAELFDDKHLTLGACVCSQFLFIDVFIFCPFNSFMSGKVLSFFKLSHHLHPVNFCNLLNPPEVMI